MQARALICDEGRSFSIRPVELPEPGQGDLLVRATWTGLSIGTETALARGRMVWGPPPLCLGYQGVGVVERVGAAVEGFQPGDTVYYRDNPVIRLLDGGAVTAATGVHCSHAVIPVATTHGVALLPKGVREDAASLFVTAATGAVGVEMAAPDPGDTAVVIGLGLVGLGAVAACARRGCRVIAVDPLETRLDWARRFGAEVTLSLSGAEADAAVRQHAPDGADLVIECTGRPELLTPAMKLCRYAGRFVWQGFYGAEPIPFDFNTAHLLCLSTFFPCDDGQAEGRRAILDHMASGALPWEDTITHRLRPEDAPAFYEALMGDGPAVDGSPEDVVGAVIGWSGGLARAGDAVRSVARKIRGKLPSDRVRGHGRRPPAVLVTGASGLIGRALAADLAARGHNVVCLSRNDPGLGLPWVCGDFTQSADLERLNPWNVDVVAHMAAILGDCSLDDALRVNVHGSHRLMAYLLARGCRKFVMASSIGAIGMQSTHFRPLQLPIPDEHPCLDRDGYGFSKYLMEQLTHFHHRRHPELDAINLRLSSVRPDDQMPPMWTDGPIPEWTLGHLTLMGLTDAVRACVLAVESPPRAGVRTMNAAATEAWAAVPVSEILRRWFGPETDVSYFEHPDRTHASVFDVTRIRDELGFTAPRPKRT